MSEWVRNRSNGMHEWKGLSWGNDAIVGGSNEHLGLFTAIRWKLEIDDQETAKQRVEAAVLALRGETRLPDSILLELFGGWRRMNGRKNGRKMDLTEAVARFRGYLQTILCVEQNETDCAILAEYRRQEAEHH